MRLALIFFPKQLETLFPAPHSSSRFKGTNEAGSTRYRDQGQGPGGFPKHSLTSASKENSRRNQIFNQGQGKVRCDS